MGVGTTDPTMGTTVRMRAWPSSITATIHRESRERKRALSSDGASEGAGTSGAPIVGGAFQGTDDCALLFFLTFSLIFACVTEARTRLRKTRKRKYLYDRDQK